MLALRQSANKIEYPLIWRPVLQSVVMSMQTDIRTVEALCVALAHGDTDAGRVLERLLEFLPRSIRNDGAIWKSDGYFWTDHRINYRKMVRARRNLKPVMESWKQKAQGAPTWHYHLDPEAMCLQLATVLDCSTIYVRTAILQNQNPENVLILAKSVKSAKSITFDSESDSDSDSLNQESKSKTVTEIEFALIGEGVSAKTAAEFAEMNILTVRRVIDAVREYDRAGKVKSKAAYLVGALRKELTPLPPTPSPTRSEGEQEQYMGSEMDVSAAQINPLDALESQVDEKYRGMWATAKEQLRFQLDRNTFNTWLADVRVIGFENDRFVLAVRNEFALETCEGRLYKSVRRLLRDASGSDVDVRFEIAQPLTVN